MMLAEQNHYVLPAGMPAVVVVLLAAAAIAAWVGSHAFKRRFRGIAAWVIMLAIRVAVGAAAVFLVMQAVQHVLVLGTSWPLWPIALGAAGGVELLLILYEHERKTIGRHTGVAIAALRIALMLLIVAMLTQPLKSLSLTKDFKRVVAVLIDDSASMHVPETQLTEAEKVRRAEMLGIVSRPYRLEDVHQDLEQIRAELAALQEWLNQVGRLDSRQRGQQLAARAAAVNESLTLARRKLDKQTEMIGDLIVGKLKMARETDTALKNFKAMLIVSVRSRLDEAIGITDDDDAAHLARSHGRLRQAVRQAAAGLTDGLPKIIHVSETIDETYYKSLPPAQRTKIDAVTRKTRHQLARSLLLQGGAIRRPGEKRMSKSLLDQLLRRYRVNVYTFASRAQSVDIKRWTEAKAVRAASLPAAQQETNIAAALQEVMTQLQGRDLAGVILLTDGRHNTPEPVEQLAHELGVQDVGVSSVVFGSKKPPRDAAVVSIDPPETVYAGDRMAVKTELKLDGLAGETVKVVLYDGEDPVANEIVRVPAGEDRVRKKIELTAEPKDPGQHHYRVHIEGADGEEVAREVFSENNTYPFTVSVSRDKTKLLLIESRPRWEYRYIKNLFDGRDRTVRLQYVLLKPDEILGQRPRATVHASASRAEDQTEATALPKDVEEWLKFDAIILGDVSPAMLGPGGIDALRKFVVDRGGTLIVIAGPMFMPHAFEQTDLRELLPVEMIQPAEGAEAMASADTAFRIALSAEGRENIIMRQHVDPKENLDVWRSVPPLYWRCGGAAMKDALVLAYALPDDAPQAVRKAHEGGAAGADVQTLREYQRRRALITVRRLDPGKIMFIGTDRTWRLRYRVGDTYHHKFWGQVLRWATATKLPSGTDFVKIGTNRTRYSPRDNIRVRVKIVRPDFTPVVSDEVAVNVFVDKKRVLRRKLEYVRDSAGIYTGSLGEMPSGAYTVELDAPVAKSLLQRDNVEKVATSFSVDPVAPAEQIELSADRGLLNRLATLSGGTMVQPSQAYEILDRMGQNEQVDQRPRQYTLWDWWPLLVVMVMIATAEWILRKKAGLA